MGGIVKCRRYEGKVALITAATAGIGFGIAVRLGQEGARLVICSRRQANVDEALHKLRAQGFEAAGIAAHVGSKEDVQKLVKLAIDTYKQIDLLVSNAAVNPASGPILDMADSAILKILEINVFAAVLLVKEVKPHLKKEAALFSSRHTRLTKRSPPSPCMP